jgi:hypothetical protein
LLPVSPQPGGFIKVLKDTGPTGELQGYGILPPNRLL